MATYQSTHTGAEIDTAIDAVSGKADSATTLSGYGITDAYTKTEANERYYALCNGTALSYSSSSPYDLNSLVAVGSYYGSGTNITYCTNRPVNRSASFRIWVSTPTGSNNSSTYKKQKFQYYDQIEAYERYTTNSGSTWTVWRLVTLPSVSSTDNGKVLEVSDGAWAAVTPVTIYSGSSAPSSGTGSNGDIYIQTS